MSYPAVTREIVSLGEVRVIVRYSVYGELDFKRVSSYMPVGQFRDLVAQKLNLDVHTVVLSSSSRLLRMNNATLEEALGTSRRVKVLLVSYLSDGGRCYAYTVLWPGWTVHHPLRKACIQLVEWEWFDRLTLLLILMNVLIMCIDDPLEDNQAPRQVFAAYVDIVFTSCFTFELCAKLGAQGFLLAPHSYLRDAWNWIDFVVVISAWITYTPPGAPEDNTSLTPLRSVRVLRPLRTVTRVRGMRVIVQSLLHSLPQMGQVAVLLAFLFLLFGVAGVQLFKGKLHHRCIPFYLPESRVALEWCAVNSFGDDVVHCKPTEFSASCAANASQDGSCLPMFADAYLLGDADFATCSPPSDNYTQPSECDSGSVCAYFSSTPNFNATSFDTFPQAVMTIMYSITLEGWTDVMYALNDSGVPFLATTFFILLVWFGAFFVINLLLACAVRPRSHDPCATAQPCPVCCASPLLISWSSHDRDAPSQRHLRQLLRPLAERGV